MFTIKSYLLPALSVFALARATDPVAAFTNATNIQQIVKHIHVMGELKELFIKKTEAPAKPVHTTKTPTLSYLKAVENGKVVMTGWGYSKSAKDTIKEYKKEYGAIIDQALEREQELCSNYYVFYHGLPNSFHIFQDFLKELNKFQNITDKKKNFEFLRMWHSAKEEIEANDFINNEIGKGYQEAIKTFVCVNLSLFGNLYDSASHSFGYFKDNDKVNTNLTEQLLKELFGYYGINTAHITELMNLNKKYITKEGRLFQIFIPKEKVDQYVYLSSAGTAPWPTSIVPSIWDSKLYRHTKIAPILDKYIEDASSIANFDSLQARLLCSKDFMLHPTGGVKIFKYETIKNKDAQNYQKELKELCDKIFAEWISSKSYQQINKTGLGRLLEFMK